VRARDKLGLKDLRLHDLRHEATSKLFERGLSPIEVATITGHKTLNTLKRYTHPNVTEIARKCTPDLFADFNGIPTGIDKTEFYQHDQNWSNRMIIGDSLQVMASLAEREGLRGKVQCIYLDPPYGIKFNSNFQWSTTSRDVKDGNAGHITREP
jgi:hypothetical protein